MTWSRLNPSRRETRKRQYKTMAVVITSTEPSEENNAALSSFSWINLEKRLRREKRDLQRGHWTRFQKNVVENSAFWDVHHISFFQGYEKTSWKVVRFCWIKKITWMILNWTNRKEFIVCFSWNTGNFSVFNRRIVERRTTSSYFSKHFPLLLKNRTHVLLKTTKNSRIGRELRTTA